MRHLTRHIVLLLLALSACAPSPSPTATATPRPPLGVPVATATAPPTATPTPIPYVFPPTVTAPPSACDDAPRPTRLVVMERGIVVEDNERETAQLVNVRAGPGTDNRVIAQMDIGAVFLVLGGPTCSPQYAWFQVRYGETVGWIAEGDREAYYVEPFLPQ